MIINMAEIYKIIFPLIGVIIGALLSYFFSKKNEASKQKGILRSDVYSDYIKAIAGISIAQRNNDNKSVNEFLFQVVNAKARITIYGSADVVKSLSNFETVGPTLVSEESKKAFLKVIATMRKDNYSKLDISLSDIGMLILGEEIK